MSSLLNNTPENMHLCLRSYSNIRVANVNVVVKFTLMVIYHPLYSMNKFVTNKSKLPQDGAQMFPYMG